jgi:dipeptidyl aminopeptidase/acylaminoacyl peptidase
MRRKTVGFGASGLAVPIVLILGLAGAPVFAQAPRTAREPLPLEVAASLHSHNSRSSFDLSPDGQWVAHTVELDETIARDSQTYAATGFPFAEGDSRMQAMLSSTMSGEVIRLGGAGGASWAAVWSPDGKRVAFYSDEGGEAGIWIWEKDTGKAERFPRVIARPFFGFEVVRWTSDSQRLLCKVLPSGMTIKQANALDNRNMEGAKRFPAVAPGQPSVFVLRSSKETTAGTKSKTEGDLRWAVADLAILDLPTRTVARIAQRTQPRFYAFSPDEKYVAYTVLKGWEANTQQPNFDLVVYELAKGTTRTLARDIRLGYGIEWSWSPDSRYLAYIASGQVTEGEIVLVSVADGALKTLKDTGVPSFDPGEGEHPPLWDAGGEHLYALGDGALWRVDAASGRGTKVGSMPGWEMMAIVARPDQRAIWLSDRGRTAWVTARERTGQRAGIFRVDLVTGKTQVALEENKRYSNVFNIAASDVTREIAFVAKDQQQAGDVWIFNTGDNRARQASHINPSLDRYELGTPRIIEWHSLDGQPLKGVLLLPPGYRAGQRLPLVLWVYGGETNAASSFNSFGFWGDMPAFNMHVLATRGYAILYPDSPLRTGSTMTDLVRTVMPGVNEAIELGYADPDRLAIMGQSYGSYCTLAIIAQTTRFKAAIITAAVLNPDLLADYLPMSPEGAGSSTGYYEHGQGNMGGTPWQYPGRYLDNSPLLLFDKVETPLLIGQGSMDGRLIASDTTFVAFQRLGKEVEYRIYENEGHVITQKPNVLDFWKRRLDFLAEHLNLTLDDKGGVVFEGDRAKARNGKESVKGGGS